MSERYESKTWTEGRYFSAPETETGFPEGSDEPMTAECGTASVSGDMYRKSKVRRRSIKVRILPSSE